MDDPGKLGRQVRGFDEAFSIDDAFAAHRKRSADAEHGYYTCKRCGKSEIQARAEGCAEGPCPMESTGQPILGHIVIDGTSIPVYRMEIALGDSLPKDSPETRGSFPGWKRELMWAAHNLIAHPVSEITHWIGYVIPPARRFGLWLHDTTIPPHTPDTGRG